MALAFDVQLADERLRYEDIRALVEPHLGGARCYRLQVTGDGALADMFVDEMGVLKELPRNAIATGVYRSHWLLSHPGYDPELLPFVAGNAVLFDRQVLF